MVRIRHLQIASAALISILSATCGFAQGQPPINQEAVKSNCSNIIALVGNVKIDCSNLSPAQKKALEDIPAILKMALANQDYLDAIMAKLEEISKATPQPSVTNNAPGGFAVSGGTLFNPQVTNNYAEKTPNILGYQIVASTSPDTELPAFTTQGHPTTSAKFYVDAAWNDPQFVAICDRPCRALDIRQAKPSGVMTFPTFRAGSISEYPTWAVFVVDMRPFETYKYYLFTVVSEDDQPVSIIRFAKFSSNNVTPQ